jgi:hypothetical protein
MMGKVWSTRVLQQERGGLGTTRGQAFVGKNCNLGVLLSCPAVCGALRPLAPPVREWSTGMRFTGHR